MNSASPFHYRYMIGIERIYGGDASLGSELEPFGGPIEPDAPWNVGGPFVWRRRTNKTVLVGWARAIPPDVAGRSGAWEAWGVDIADAATLQRWPFAWEELRREPSPDSLKRLAGRLADEPTAGLPALNGGEAAALQRAYIAFIEGAGETVFVPLEQPADVAVLPWLWLFGPQNPAQATLTTPRSGPPTVHPSPTYAPRIDLSPPEESFVSPRVQEIIQHVAARKLRKAQETAQQLRRLPPAELLATLKGSAYDDQYTTTVNARGDGGAAGRPRLWRIASSIRAPRSIDRTLLVAILAAALTSVGLGLRLQPEWPTSAVTGTVTDTSQTAGAAVTGTAASDTASEVKPIDATTIITQTPMWTESVHGALIRSRAPHPADIQTLLQRPGTSTFSDVERLKLRIAAWQLYLRSKGLYKSSLDALPGASFFNAVTKAGDDEQLRKILDSNEELGKWAAGYNP